jgi:predicted RNA-binding Zn-ribbon protein involved in translation (DUF1610 family)
MDDEDYYNPVSLWTALREKLTTHVCPFCNEEDWASRGLTGAPVRSVAGAPTSNIDCLVVVCENCGFVRSHAIWAIRRP